MAAAEKVDLGFVCCVEAGWLEDTTARLAESLRQWGGRLKDSPVLAFTPRFGPTLSAKTKRRFDAAGVEYHRLTAANPIPWFKFMNKPAAMRAATTLAKTEQLAWIDSDMFIVTEPWELMLQPGEDTTACAADKNVGTSGPNDPNESYWRALAAKFGLDLEQFPWITEQQTGEKIRLNWNSGIFSYRRETAFTEEYFRICQTILNDRIAGAKSGLFYTDQVALSLTMVKLGLKYRELGGGYNYPFSSRAYKHYDAAKLRGCKVLHYHDGLWPHFFPTFVERLKEELPAVGEWTASQGPLTVGRSIPMRVGIKAIKTYREQKFNRYSAACPTY